MALTKNQLISRLARELYDLKFKLNVIRDITEDVCTELKRQKNYNKLGVNYLLIDIINQCDDEELYNID